MINVVNTLIEKYGKPDEIRVELARELKKNAKERDLMSSAIAKATRENAAIKEKLKKLSTNTGIICEYAHKSYDCGKAHQACNGRQQRNPKSG